MPAYAAAVPRPPRTLTELEQAALLKVTGEHRDGFRDQVIFAVALGTGLREHEIAALDVGDVLHEDGRVCRRIALRTLKRRAPSLPHRTSSPLARSAPSSASSSPGSAARASAAPGSNRRPYKIEDDRDVPLDQPCLDATNTEARAREQGVACGVALW
jgi:integrase